jgi:hypothetical protein
MMMASSKSMMMPKPSSTGMVAHTSPAGGAGAGAGSGSSATGAGATPSPSTVPFNAAGRTTISGLAVVFGALFAAAMQF